MAAPKTALRGPVRVRFAPSPTGYLHVGGARTAIFNELLRRRLGGAFVLRIEDTDKARSDEAMVRQIESALAWVGVRWDEGPFLQSERVKRHRERTEELLAAGRAYRCFCAPEELESLRKATQRKGVPFRYPRTCLNLSKREVEERLKAGDDHAVRFKMPDGHVRFTDLVRGEMDFAPAALDDFILLRSDRSPTYHMSVVCDDIDMGITHVVRGEDHLSNTPKHIPLFEALEAPVPAFAHLPLILGPDRRRLSKRAGATSVEELRDEGILPQALYNFLALLGWSPGDDREILSREEMIELFTVERLHAAAAVFDHEKLVWMNAQYLSRLPLEEVLEHLRPFLAEAGLEGAEPGRLRAAVELHRTRARTLGDLAQAVRPYFARELRYDPQECGKFLGDGDLPGHLDRLRRRYAEIEAFDKETLETALRALAEELGVKAGALIHPTRMALTGARVGPPVFDVVEAMGREATERHLGRFIDFLERQSPPEP